MYQKIIAGFLVFATTAVFGMSLAQLNSASKTELMEIKGIGEAKTTAIMEERKKGEFKSFEDFQRVKSIGKKMAENVKNNVRLSATVKKNKNI